MPTRRITLLDYQASWSSDFEVVASDLRATLGVAALQVDHIGSTAVPGLCAKDIIDVQVTVRLLDSSVVHQLRQAGFTTHGDPWRQDHVPPGFEANPQDWTKLFFMQRQGERRSNIHVRQVGRPNQAYALLIRDFLRYDNRAAQAYARLKQRLAVALADPDSYPDVKDPAADLLYLAAERWAGAEDRRGGLPG